MNKIIRKSISLMLAFCLVISLSATAFANQSSNNNLSKKELETKKIVVDVANGGDSMVGGGKPFDAPPQATPAPGEITPQWASGGTDHTHQFLTARGITILENDKSITYYYQNSYATTIMQYSDMPDVDEQDSPTYFKGHFYDPATGKNYMNETSPTALTRFTDHYNSAVSKFPTDKTGAMQELGRALHYLADVNEPHHASNKIAVGSNHVNFETSMDAWRTDFGITTSDKYTYVTSNTIKTCIDACGNNAKAYINYAESLNYNDMATAAGPTMGYAQKFIAGYLYKFLKDVGQI
ncbi:MAG: zinc dependent phospholipase C family protein [Clostridia bacterium]|nr:zinc dependent phospholipase C family protein [Clostridia bacterium]